jgi:hypothetical protein
MSIEDHIIFFKLGSLEFLSFMIIALSIKPLQKICSINKMKRYAIKDNIVGLTLYCHILNISIYLLSYRRFHTFFIYLHHYYKWEYYDPSVHE